MNRRQVTKALMAMAAGTAVAPFGAVNAAVQSEAVIFFSAEEIALLSAVAEQILPRTATPGAIDANVPRTIDLLLRDWADAETQQFWRIGLKELGKSLADGERAFADLDAAQQTAVLTEYDADAVGGTFGFDIAALLGNEAAKPFYPELKYTICEAFFYSRPGATEVLRYQPVPGRWEPCIPYTPGDRAWLTTRG